MSLREGESFEKKDLRVRECYRESEALRQGFGVDTVVALPKSILASMRTEIYPRKAFTPKEFKTAFAKHGYGPGKTVKWLEYYLEVGLITELEDGRLTCTTW